MDDSVRELMIVVKKWAKDNKICSAQDNSLSSYAWMCMVVFYLQCLSYVPNLQCPKLMEKAGIQRDSNNYWHNVNDLDTCYLTWEQAQKVWKRPEVFGDQPFSCTALLYGFFHFYAIDFTRSVSMISVKRGREEILPKTTFRKCSNFFCIEDPFETFDSHMPHDLGIPVNETQCARIFDFLQKGEEHLRSLLLGSDADDGDTDGDEDEEMTLWPTIEATQIGQTGGGKKGKKKKRHNKGGGGGGRGGGPVVDRKQNPTKKEGDNTGNAQKQPAQTKGTAKHGAHHSKKGGPNNQPKVDNPTTQEPGQATKGSHKSGHHKGRKRGGVKAAHNNTVANEEGQNGDGNNRHTGKGKSGGGGRRRGGGGRNGKGDGDKKQHQKQPVDQKN